MIIEIAKWVVIIFGIYIIFIGFLMLFNPIKVRNILRKAGSTNLINYTEITLRLIPGIALIVCSELSKIPIAFKIFGWIILITSLILYIVPRKIHHKFSIKSTDLLTSFYLQLISPFAFLFGGLIIYNVF